MKCKSACSFNAIVILPSINFIEVSEDMCHGCGVCAYVCPEQAITEKKERNRYHYVF
ncbi:MAG: 4Fe-4S binding protein [Bacteroidales bacterium]|nr:4Fe-4S binding protein [Bacteroidales bacterium]